MSDYQQIDFMQEMEYQYERPLQDSGEEISICDMSIESNIEKIYP